MKIERIPTLIINEEPVEPQDFTFYLQEIVQDMLYNNIFTKNVIDGDQKRSTILEHLQEDIEKFNINTTMSDIEAWLEIIVGCALTFSNVTLEHDVTLEKLTHLLVEHMRISIEARLP